MKTCNNLLKGEQMSNRGMQISIVVLLVGVLIIGFAGCKGKSDTETAGETEVKTPTPSPVAQTTCPIMGNPIDKAVSTEYQGQKVYFCCPACVEKFKGDPEKYVKDLPQFKK